MGTLCRFGLYCLSESGAKFLCWVGGWGLEKTNSLEKPLWVTEKRAARVIAEREAGAGRPNRKTAHAQDPRQGTGQK